MVADWVILICMESITENNKISTEKANELWSQFKTGFWLLFFLHIVLKFFIYLINSQPSPNPASATTANIVILVLGLCIALGMMCLVGWTSYKLSGKKINLLYGIFGALWFGVILIFISYLVVQHEYHKAAGIKPSKGFRLM